MRKATDQNKQSARRTAVRVALPSNHDSAERERKRQDGIARESHCIYNPAHSEHGGGDSGAWPAAIRQGARQVEMADMMVMDPRSIMAKIADGQRLRSSPKAIYA